MTLHLIAQLEGHIICFTKKHNSQYCITWQVHANSRALSHKEVLRPADKHDRIVNCSRGELATNPVPSGKSLLLSQGTSGR